MRTSRQQVASILSEKIRWLLALVALACLPNASAAEYSLTVGQEKFYADEVVTGTGVVLDYHRDRGPELGVDLSLTAGDADGIDEGDVMEITFTLINAQFATNVRTSALQPTLLRQQAGRVRVRSVADGERGDTSVTFELEAPEDLRCDTGCDLYLVFELQELTGLTRDPTTGTVKPVTWQVSTAASRSSGWPDTTTTSVAPLERCDEPDWCVRSENGVLQFLQPPAQGTSRQEPHPIVRFIPGLTFSATSTGASSIDLAGGRVGFTAPSQANLGSVRVGLASAAACTARDPIGPLCPRQSDGREFTIGPRGGGRGSLNIEVDGDFRDGDQVWLDLDDNDEPSTNELLDLTTSGSMRGSFRLYEVAGNARAAEGDAAELDREQGVATRNLFYRPNGTDPMRPGAIRSRYAVDFDTAMDKPAQPATGEHTISYRGIVATRRAHAIAPITVDDATSSTFVRIKCEIAPQCMVYLECDDTTGNSWFAPLRTPIDGRSTRVLNQQAIATILGAGEAGWRGDLACTAYATRDISVQVLNRSGGILANSTYIDR